MGDPWTLERFDAMKVLGEWHRRKLKMAKAMGPPFRSNILN
jgi:hypothetical protein